MISNLAFFSVIRLSDNSRHGEYNRWHALDHRPENLALPGVEWGDRWKVRDDYRALGRGEVEFSAVDYVSMYWFRSPVEQAVAEWDALGEQSFQWGRGPLIPGVQRPMLAFFRPVKGYAAPKALVAPEVLPYRPNRGIHVTLTRFDDPHGIETHHAHEREDREVIPALLDLPGVAGAWTFSYSHPQRHSSLPFDASASEQSGGMRVRLVYLDADPADVTPSVAEIDDAVTLEHARRVFSMPLATIEPWRDW